MKVLTGDAGAVSRVEVAVAGERTAALLAWTTSVAVPGSVEEKLFPPSVDHCPTKPGGTRSEPGTYVWLTPAPWIGSAMTAPAGEGLGFAYDVTHRTVSPWPATVVLPVATSVPVLLTGVPAAITRAAHGKGESVTLTANRNTTPAQHSRPVSPPAPRPWCRRTGTGVQDLRTVPFGARARNARVVIPTTDRPASQPCSPASRLIKHPIPADPNDPDAPTGRHGDYRRGGPPSFPSAAAHHPRTMPGASVAAIEADSPGPQW